MTDAFIASLLALAAISLGLRLTSVLIPGVHPLARMLIAAVIGTALTMATLELCNRYQVHDLGLGLLVALAPVGIYDVSKWWFRWRKV
jgi:hypothetical protein